jgi:putative transposase
MPRQARLDAAGTLHHVIIRGIERRRIVDDDHDRRQFVSRLGKVASETGTAVYAWTLMTNHAYIIEATSGRPLAGRSRGTDVPVRNFSYSLFQPSRNM